VAFYTLDYRYIVGSIDYIVNIHKNIYTLIYKCVVSIDYIVNIHKNIYTLIYKCVVSID
jgi:hypothetical protein